VTRVSDRTSLLI
jgi:hypothetical protein